MEKWRRPPNYLNTIEDNYHKCKYSSLRWPELKRCLIIVPEVHGYFPRLIQCRVIILSWVSLQFTCFKRSLFVQFKTVEMLCSFKQIKISIYVDIWNLLNGLTMHSCRGKFRLERTKIQRQIVRSDCISLWNVEKWSRKAWQKYSYTDELFVWSVSVHIL